MAKRLYQITDTHARNNKPVEGLHFDDKKAAKTKRRELNGDPEEHPLRYVVSPGPDHHNYKG